MAGDIYDPCLSNIRDLSITFFPSGEGVKKDHIFTIDDPRILLSSCKKNADHYELILFNASDAEIDAKITVHLQERVEKVHFEKYELLTLFI